MSELKNVNELCWEIEKLPASEQQTKVSLLAVEFVEYYKDISSALAVEENAHEKTRAELAAVNGRLARMREALAESAMPYEALLIDRDSRNWIAPELWKMIEHFAQKARAALKGSE